MQSTSSREAQRKIEINTESRVSGLQFAGRELWLDFTAVNNSRQEIREETEEGLEK